MLNDAQHLAFCVEENRNHLLHSHFRLVNVRQRNRLEAFLIDLSCKPDDVLDGARQKRKTGVRKHIVSGGGAADRRPVAGSRARLFGPMLPASQPGGQRVVEGGFAGNPCAPGWKPAKNAVSMAAVLDNFPRAFSPPHRRSSPCPPSFILPPFVGLNDQPNEVLCFRESGSSLPGGNLSLS